MGHSYYISILDKNHKLLKKFLVEYTTYSTVYYSYTLAYIFLVLKSFTIQYKYQRISIFQNSCTYTYLPEMKLSI